jgi:hypothetical protein
MGYSLACQVRMIEGLSHMDKAVLGQLALATPKDSITVSIRLDTLARYASCAERTAQYALRRLEKAGYLVPGGEKGGRGHALKFDIIVAPSLVESAPVVQPDHIPPTNGHNGYKPPSLPDRKDGLTAYRDPFARRADETALEYARRVDRRGT